MATAAQLRVVTHDKEKVKAEEVVGVGDGTRTKWVLEMYPIKADSEVITVAGVAQTSTTDYTINDDTGLITFGSAPSDESEILTTTYSYYALSDADLAVVLAQDSNLFLAAAICLRIIAADSAKLFAWWSGDERVDMSKVAGNLLKVAESFEERYDRGKLVPASGAELWEVTEETFGDQLDLDSTEYLDDSV